MENLVERVKEQLQENAESLHIRRLPTPTKQEFKKRAIDEFSNDYGMTLKAYVDECKLYKQAFDLFTYILTKLDERITNLENKDESQPRIRKNIMGKVLAIGQKSDGLDAETIYDTSDGNSGEDV